MMQAIKRTLIEMKRNGIENLLILLALLTSILLAAAYINTIQNLDLSLHKLADTLPVQAKITDISGINQAGLSIDHASVDKLFQNKYVDQIICTSQAFINHVDGYQNTVVSAANTIKAFSFITDAKIVFADGFDSHFLEKNKDYCILESNYAKANHAQLNQTITLPLSVMQYSDRSSSFSFIDIGLHDVTVIGIYESDKPTEDSAKVVVPVHWLKEIVEANDDIFYYDSLQFQIKDPLQLNEFKQEMKHMNFHSIEQNQNEGFVGNALMVQDTFFIESASHLQSTLSLYKIMQVPFFVLIMILLYVVLFLIMRYQRYSIAIAFSLGVSKKRQMCHYLGQQFILMGISSVIASILLMQWTHLSLISICQIILSMFLISFMSSYLCLHHMMKKNVLALLTNAE